MENMLGKQIMKTDKVYTLKSLIMENIVKNLLKSYTQNLLTGINFF